MRVDVVWFGLISARSDRDLSTHLIVDFTSTISLHFTHLFLLKEIDQRETTNCFISTGRVYFSCLSWHWESVWVLLNLGSLLVRVDFSHTFLASGHVSNACSTDSEARWHLSQRLWGIIVLTNRPSAVGKLLVQACHRKNLTLLGRSKFHSVFHHPDSSCDAEAMCSSLWLTATLGNSVNATVTQNSLI